MTYTRRYFGVWLSESPPIILSGTRYLLVRCGCGARKYIPVEDLASKRSRSCRHCAARMKDGRSPRTLPEYAIWRNIKTRISNTNRQNYHNYGGRGLKIAVAWTGPDGFAEFYHAVGPKPSPEHSIDRINNNEGYYGFNCRWATRAEQARNKRTNKFITIRGRRLCLQEWAEQPGAVYAELIATRLGLGWSKIEAVYTPVRAHRRSKWRRSHDAPT